MQAITVNGAQVGYVEEGTGAPHIVFVHGWSCDHTFFAPQVEHFSGGHRCVSVDLRGHYGLDAPVGSATVPAHAADVIALCDALAIERPVVAGHSMGGAVALEIAAQAPELAAGLVLVDPAPLFLPPEANLDGFVAALESPDYQTMARGFIEQNLFMPTDDEATRTRVTDLMLRAPQHVMASEMRSIGSWGAPRQSHTWTLPVINILAGRTVADPGPLGERCTNLETVTTPGVGHFNQLLAADAVNELIEKFLGRL